MEKVKEKVQSVITGIFPAKRFFDTLAGILSRQEGMEITVKVTQLDKEEEVSAGQ